MARFDLSDAEWSIIAPLLPNKPREVPRTDDRRVLNGISPFCEPARRGAICRIDTARRYTTALTAGPKLGWAAGVRGDFGPFAGLAATHQMNGSPIAIKSNWLNLD